MNHNSDRSAGTSGEYDRLLEQIVDLQSALTKTVAAYHGIRAEKQSLEQLAAKVRSFRLFQD